MDVRIDPVDDEVGLVAHPVAGEALAQDAACHRRTGDLTVDPVCEGTPVGRLGAQGIVHQVIDFLTLAHPGQG